MVEGHQELLSDVILPEHSQKVQMLLCLLDDSHGVCSPGEFGRDRGAQKSEGLDPIHAVAIDVKRGRICPVLPKVQDDLLCLCGVQSQVVCRASRRQFQDLIPVGRLISS